MDAGPEVFETHLDRWLAWRESPWGRIRFRVVHEVLRRTCESLGTSALRILDLGGGDGGDAIPLARLGHRVTVADFSPTLLNLAASSAAESGVADRVALVCSDLGDLSHKDLGKFDLVLCHNVLQYRDDAVATVGTLAEFVSARGALSVLAPNPANEIITGAIRSPGLATVIDQVSASTSRAETFEHEIRRIEPEEGKAVLLTNGFPDVRQFGIRCVTDFISDDDRKFDSGYYTDLERLELALCDKEPFIGTAKFWLLIGRRRPSQV